MEEPVLAAIEKSGLKIDEINEVHRVWCHHV